MRRPASSSDGFTLIEVLVVLGIVGLILASVVFARPRTAAVRVDMTARAVAVSLQLARHRAMTTSADVVFVVDPMKGEFGLPGAMHKLPRGMSIAVTVAETERFGDSGGLRYYPDGQSSGGSILLTYEGRDERIAVNWLTGEPRLSR